LFYLTCRVEKIVAMVAEEVVGPALADGGVVRNRIADYVRDQVPSWSPNSVKDVGAAVVRTYERFGVGSPTRTRLNVSIRRGALPAFAYVLHLEFPEPGMYAFDRLLQGPMRRWLLWDPQWIVQQLYACGEAGLLAKVSEIDGTRQFTTKFALEQAVEPIVGLIDEREP
jgi:DNA repair protein RadC